MMKSILFVSLILIGLQSSAKADVTLVGGLSMPLPAIASSNSAVTASTTSKNDFSLGLFASKSFTPLFSVESGFLYFKRRFNQTVTDLSGTSSLDLTSMRFQLPLLLRATFLPTLSAGAGFYYENGLGDYDGTLGGIVGTATYSDLNMKKEQYGLVFDIRFKLPITPFLGLIADARYQMSLAEEFLDTSILTFKMNSFQLLGGLNLGF